MARLVLYPQQFPFTFPYGHVSVAITSAGTSFSFAMMISCHLTDLMKGDIERAQWVLVPYLFTSPVKKQQHCLAAWKYRGFCGEA